MSAAATSYDALPYEGGAFPLTHPLKLGVIAALQGLEVAPVRTCRVLEIGCGDGSNLLPLAESFPEAQFHGFDLGQRHIDTAQRVARELGLSNVVFEQKDVLDFDPAGQTYDYILAHGIFSWVPDSVRARILEVTRDCLSDRGVATISYNTLPGWHLRGALRDMLRIHSRHCRSSAEKLGQGRALLQFLADGAPKGSAYGAYLAFELKALMAMPDSYLLHEFLEGENRAFSLRTFVDFARRHGLNYVGDAKRLVTAAGSLTPGVRAALTRMTRDAVEFEQYADFVSVRSFRRSVLVRSGRSPSREVHTDVLRRCWFTSDFRPASPTNGAEGGAERFSTPRGLTFSTQDGLIRAVLQRIAQAGPLDVSFDELWQACRASTPETHGSASTHGPEVLEQLLHALHNQAVVDVALEPYPRAGRRSDRPCVTAFARFEAQHRLKVTSRRHVGMKVDPFTRWLLPRLDGTRTRAQLLDDYVGMVASGELTLQVAGKTLLDPVQVRVVAEEHLELGLQQLEAASYLLP